jgi:hypothetical protein
MRPNVDISGLGSATAAQSSDPILREKIGGLEKQLTEAIKVRDAAVASGDRLKSLEAEKIAAANEAALYRQKAKELDEYGKTLDKQIRQEREHEIQVKLYWATGIIIGLSIIALGFGIWFQLQRLVIGGVCGLGLAGFCWVTAALVPYLLWIGIAVLVIGIATLAILLYRRHMALTQVVAAVEAMKPEEGVEMKITDYKTHFQKFMDTTAENIVEVIRDKMKK